MRSFSLPRWAVRVLMFAAMISAFFAATSISAARPSVSVHCTGKLPIPKPRACNFRVPYHDSFRVKNIRWSGWGTRHAVGLGTYTATGERLRIHLTRREVCQPSTNGYPTIMTYTFMRVKTRAWSKPLRFGLPRCDGSTYSTTVGPRSNNPELATRSGYRYCGPAPRRAGAYLRARNLTCVRARRIIKYWLSLGPGVKLHFANPGTYYTLRRYPGWTCGDGAGGGGCSKGRRWAGYIDKMG